MSEKDVQISYGRGFEPLLSVLAKSRRPGSAHTNGELETAMPIVEVSGVGMLSFPVPQAQARRLIENAAERAPYGKGEQTLVDESVRKVWQIPSEMVRISGKGWVASFKELVRKIGDDLGCEGLQIEAEFYKLLIYEKGGFFLPHRDSEKAGGMFGTLVVTLPSVHKGGELIVQHAGREAMIDLRCEAPSEIRYAAFYADCQHEVRPVRAGYRVCLVYNLVQKKRKKPLTAPNHRSAISAATPLLAAWASGGGAPEKIVYLLEHHYTQASLSFSALKGADAALAQVLVPAAAQARCAVHLAIVHIEESGWAEHTGGGSYGRRSRRWRWDDDFEEEDDEEFAIGEVCDGRYYIDQWRATGDAAVDFGEVPIGQGEILPPGALDHEPPDQTHFSEATGNVGASFERTYLRAALVIWPEERFDRICASGGPDAALARLEQLVTAAEKAAAAKREQAEDAVRRLARALPSLDSDDSEKPERVSRLLKALRRFGDADLVLEVGQPVLIEFYDGSQKRALLDVVSMLGEARASALLTAVVEERGPHFPDETIELWTSLAKKYAKGRQLLNSTLDALLKAIAEYKPPKRPEWARGSLYRAVDFEALERTRPRKPVSAETLSALLATLHKGPRTAKWRDIIHGVVERPELFTVEKVVVPALEQLASGAAKMPTDDLWAHCANHYLQRSEHPPTPPRDWAQKVKLPGKSPLIRELEAFARDPQAQVHRFRVRKELRQELHRAIDEADLDMKHVTDRTGSPQTLVCTKTRASYERACQQYRKDKSEMRRLLALPGARVRSNGPLAQRLRQAAGAK